MIFEINLDSSVIISQLVEDKHIKDVTKALMHLVEIKASIYVSLIVYAEIWTGIELIDDSKIQKELINNLHQVLRALDAKIVSDNVVIARRAAQVQAEYRKSGGKREILIPDFLIGANAEFYSKRLLTTNPRDFMKYFPEVEVLTPSEFIKRYVVTAEKRRRQKNCRFK